MYCDTKQHQVYALLKKRMEEGIYPPGFHFPKEVELARELGVSRITLRPALKKLADDKLIDRVKGVGTFVHDAARDRLKILVLNDAQNPVFPFFYIYPGMQECARDLNVSLELCSTSDLPVRQATFNLSQLHDTGYHGIIWFTNNFTGFEKNLSMIRQLGLPVLLPHAVADDFLKTGFHVMGINVRQVLEDGLSYLARQGHHRVAHFTSPDMRGLTPEDYFNGIAKAGLDDDPQLLRFISDYWKTAQVIPILEQLMLDNPSPPTALLCFSDFFVSTIYDFCDEHHIRIPQDLAILSIGGHISCKFLKPTLSTIDFDSPGIGRKAMEYFSNVIRGNLSPRKFIVNPHQIIERESTSLTL